MQIINGISHILLSYFNIYKNYKEVNAEKTLFSIKKSSLVKKINQMRILIAILTFCLVYNVGAQTAGQLANNQMSAGGSNDIVSYLLGDIASSKKKRQNIEADIQGSAYTSDEFLPGKLFFKDEFQTNVFYRYKAYGEEIEIKNVNTPDAPVYGLQRDKNIGLVASNGKSMGFKTFIDKKGLTQNGYLAEMVTGKYTLYKRSDVKYTQPQKAQNSFIAATPARFSKFTEYYLELQGRDRIDELELKKNKFLKLVSDSEKEAFKGYLKENGINLKNESDLLKALTYLNK